VRLLAAVGLVILLVNGYEDVGIFRDGDPRQIAGHAVREALVAGAVCGLLWPRPGWVPFMAGAGLHGLFVWWGYFSEARDAWGLPWTWFGVSDVGWRCAVLACAWRMRGEFWNDLLGRR